jgi:chromosome segregation ATPase
MELEAKELIDLLKTIPVIQSDMSVMKKSIGDIDTELDITKSALSKAASTLERIDSSSTEITSLKYTVKSLQNNIETIAEKLRDMAEKQRDIITTLKDHDKNIDDKVLSLTKTIYKIENQTKESITKHESTEHAIHSLSTIVSDISKRENIIENTMTKDDNVSITEKLIKIAPNLIAIISFLGYIIYTLIEHKLQGKM